MDRSNLCDACTKRSQQCSVCAIQAFKVEVFTVYSETCGGQGSVANYAVTFNDWLKCSKEQQRWVRIIGPTLGYFLGSEKVHVDLLLSNIVQKLTEAYPQISPNTIQTYVDDNLCKAANGLLKSYWSFAKRHGEVRLHRRYDEICDGLTENKYVLLYKLICNHCMMSLPKNLQNWTIISESLPRVIVMVGIKAARPKK